MEKDKKSYNDIKTQKDSKLQISKKFLSKNSNDKIIKKPNAIKRNMRVGLPFPSRLKFTPNLQKNKKTNNKSIHLQSDYDNLMNKMDKMFENQKSIDDKLNEITESLKKSGNNQDKNTNTSASKCKRKKDSLNSNNKIDSLNSTKRIKFNNDHDESKEKVLKMVSTLSNDLKEDQILEQQIEAFKQIDKEFEGDDFDEDLFNYDINKYTNESLNIKRPRRHITLEYYMKKNAFSLKKKYILNNTFDNKEDKATFKCPYCNYEYFDDIEETVYHELLAFLEANHMEKDGKIISSNVPFLKQYEFCRLHQAKLVIIPQGLQKGYPLHINFDLLQERIERFKEDLFHIIYGRKKSYFRELALKEYKRFGTNKARNYNLLIQRFDKTFVGYYGSKGFNIITEILLNMFFVKRKENELLTESKNEETKTVSSSSSSSSTFTNNKSKINNTPSTSTLNSISTSTSITPTAITSITTTNFTTTNSTTTNSTTTNSTITNSTTSTSTNIINTNTTDSKIHTSSKNSSSVMNTEKVSIDMNKSNKIDTITSKNEGSKNQTSLERYNTVIKTEKILTFELTKPQKPFEYIQEVLVPECGVRLIAEDQHLQKDNEEDIEKARKIMEESNDFGLVVHEF